MILFSEGIIAYFNIINRHSYQMTEQEFNNSDVSDVTMTSYMRLRRSAFLNESTWSPMPEHILNLHIEEFQPEEKKVF